MLIRTSTHIVTAETCFGMSRTIFTFHREEKTRNVRLHPSTNIHAMKTAQLTN